MTTDLWVKFKSRSVSPARSFDDDSYDVLYDDGDDEQKRRVMKYVPTPRCPPGFLGDDPESTTKGRTNERTNERARPPKRASRDPSRGVVSSDARRSGEHDGDRLRGRRLPPEVIDPAANRSCTRHTAGFALQALHGRRDDETPESNRRDDLRSGVPRVP